MTTSVLLAAVAVAACCPGYESCVCSSTDDWSGRKSHLAVVNPPVPATDGSVLSLRGTWEFAQFRHALEARDLKYVRDRDFWGNDSSAWKNLRTIEVPGCWEAQGVGEPGPGFSYNARPASYPMRHVHLGNGFYRRRVTIPAEWAGRRVWLKVGMARTWAWAWIDDKAVAHFSEGHRALKWDVTDLVTPGRECEVKFQVDNSYIGWRNSQTLSFHRWGGLVRDVELEATPKTYIDDAWVRGDFDARVAEAHVEIGGKVKEWNGGKVEKWKSGKVEEWKGGKVRVTVEGEAKEAEISSSTSGFTLEVPLADFRPWSPEHPNLYTAKVELVSADGAVVQTRFERFGVRKLEVRGKEFFLNGKPFFFRGFGDDHVYPIEGMSPASKERHLEHFRMARAAGFNFVRLHTHCEIPEYFDAADEAGVFVQPELSYNCDESSVETFRFDPVGDARAIWQGYRRHPSFAVYSGGNEGTLGPNGGRALYNWVHENDPDRLVVEQDGGTYFEGHREDTSDYASGPMSMWERGSFNKRAFICHEYANLAIKGDARTEGDYTGVWQPRMTREMRRKNLAPAGLGDEWGDRLQDAQHDFQRMWALRSVEAARKDPFCDGYIFWTIVDVTHFGDAMNAPNCQGLFNSFWRPKLHGTTPADMAVVNSETAILLDTENRVRTYVEDNDPMLCCGSLRRLVIDETNRVFSAGETIHADFILAHYGERPLSGARLEWSLEADGKALSSGGSDIGERTAGPAESVFKTDIVVPSTERPVKATLKAAVVAGGERRAANGWDFWLFPKCGRADVPQGVVVAGYGTPEADSARKAGKSLLLVGNRKGERDIYPGWWATDWRNKKWTQNGTAAVRHAVWGDFPFEPFLSPLMFRIIGQGTPLPVEGFEEKDFVMVGEGNTDFKLYLAAKKRPDGGREVFVSGLDLDAPAVEAATLRRNILAWLSSRGEDNYDFRRRLACLHPPRRMADAPAPKPGETLVGKGWRIVAETDAPVVRHAAADLSDYFAKSMREDVPVAAGGDGNRVIRIGVDPSLPGLQARVEVGEREIRISGGTPREAAQGCYRLEDAMNLRGLPAVERGVRTYTRMFSPRMAHSGWELEKFPDVYLDHMAHAGMDAILVYITESPDVTRNGREDIPEIVRRAGERGIDVYAYAHQIAAASHMHPDDPDAAEFCDRMWGSIVKNAPGLKGMVFVGESIAFTSRDPTIKGFWWKHVGPQYHSNGFWPTLEWAPWLELVRDATRKYNPDFDVVFWTYNWSYAPEKDRLALLEKIPTNVTVHVTFEMGDKRPPRNGVNDNVDDYSIVHPGPSSVFRSEAEVASRRGIRLTAMANTGGRTWDCGVVPFEPVPERWTARHRALREAHRRWNLAGLMDSHHYGFLPNFIAEIAKVSFTEEASDADVAAALRGIAARDFGAANADAVLAAWHDWSEAFTWHSARWFDQGGPLRIGPTFPLVLPGGEWPLPPHPQYEYYEGTRYGNGWKYLGSRYDIPVDQIPGRLATTEREIELWRSGNDRLEKVMPGVAPERRPDAERMLGLGRFYEHAIRTVRNAILFKRDGLALKEKGVSAAERNDLARRLLATIDDEEANVRETIPFVVADSMLGWEPSMFYVADREHLEWKLRQLDDARRSVRELAR